MDTQKSATLPYILKSMMLGNLNLAHLIYICSNLRQSDKDEVFATRDDTSPEELACSIFSRRDSGVAWIAYSKTGVPVAAFGAYRQCGSLWGLWMMATNDWKEVARGVTKFGIKFVMPFLFERMGMKYGHCISSADNQAAHRWIARLGGHPDSGLTHWGKNGEDFIRFIWVAQ